MEEILEVSCMNETEQYKWQKRRLTGVQHLQPYQYDHTVNEMRCTRHAQTVKCVLNGTWLEQNPFFNGKPLVLRIFNLM
jgi:hypothetical protein